MSEYYSQVVSDLINYREYKQRCEIILIELDEIAEEDMGVSYDGVNVESNGFHSKTETAVMERQESPLQEELTKKKRIVEKVENAYEGLDPVEQFIIKRKYMKGRIVKDVNVYTHPNFEWGKNKYYEFKNNAVKKLARILGYTEK